MLPPTPKPGKPAPNPSSLAETPRVVAKDTSAVAAPDFGATVDLPPVVESGLELATGESGPTDLPPPGSGPRFELPEPPATEEAEAPSGNSRRATGNLGHRIATDIKSVIELLGWSATTYFRRPTAFLLLAAMVVLPASFLQSCLATALVPTPPSNVLARSPTTPHFEQRKAELAKRIQDAQARGEMDAEAAVALAALTAAGNAAAVPPKVDASESGYWLRMHGIMFLHGLLILGLAFPLACAFLALALFDRDSGAALPGLVDVWPIVVARAELFLLALLPAALLVALGNALYVVPGLVASVLFVFLPHVVLFEKRGGGAALSRSLELAKADAIRGALTLLSFALAVAVVALVAEAVLPTSASRAVAFTHFIVCDVLVVAILPIPALVLARVYLDQRGPKVKAEGLSLAARS